MHTKTVSIIAAALVLALSSSASAGPKPQTSLVQPSTFECNFDPNSVWEDSNTNAPNPYGAKYGGDLDTAISYHWVCTIDEQVTSGDDSFNFEIDLSKDPTTLYSYSCSGEAPNAVCTGTLDFEGYYLAVQAATESAISAHCPEGSSTEGSTAGITGVTAGVKAMIPGKNNGRQNYPVFNCTVPLPS